MTTTTDWPTGSSDHAASNVKTATIVGPVTPEMVQAGLEELRDRVGENDLVYLVASVYLAMECQRLDSLGQFRGLIERSVKS